MIIVGYQNDRAAWCYHCAPEGAKLGSSEFTPIFETHVEEHTSMNCAACGRIISPTRAAGVYEDATGYGTLQGEERFMALCVGCANACVDLVKPALDRVLAPQTLCLSCRDGASRLQNSLLRERAYGA